MFEEKQSQQSGDNSVNIQGKNVSVIKSGLSYADARQIAVDVFEANFYRLSEVAAATAKERADKLIDMFLQKLSEKNPDALEQMKEPDMQYAIYTAQKEYARTGDENIADMLVDVLVDRASQNQRSLMQIVLNESLSVVPKLTLDQLNALSLIFQIKYLRYLRFKNLEAIPEYIEKYYAPFLLNTTKERACYQHLQFAGCGNISIGGSKIESIFRNNYPGLFSKGFTKEQAESIVGTFDSSFEKLLFPCLHNSSLNQVKAIDDETIQERVLECVNDEQIVEKMKNLQNKYLMSEMEIKDYLISVHPKMEQLFDLWDNSHMRNMTLSSVGIAIGHSNIRRTIGETFDLSIWIK